MGSFDLIVDPRGLRVGGSPRRIAEGHLDERRPSAPGGRGSSTSPCTVIVTVRTSSPPSFVGATLERSVALRPSIERMAKSAQRIVLVASCRRPSTSSHVRACSVCVASSSSPNVCVVKVVEVDADDALATARGPRASTSSVPAAAVVSALMCSLTPGMSTCVVLFGSTA